MQTLARKPRETGRDYALRTLKDNIIHLELAPGSMVSENELAVQLGLSRTPVREALQELSKVKLVDVYPQRGSAVALIDYDLVEEARFMRNVLECAVVELACQMASVDDLLLLEQNVSLQEHHLAAGANDRLWALDNEFHRRLFRIANKENSWEILTGFTVHFDRVRTMSLNTVKGNKSVADHRALYELITAGDVNGAKELMQKHLNRYKVDAGALREQYPKSYFKQK